MSIVTIPTVGQFGLVADQPAQELPSNAWSRVENMRFRNGLAERFDGHISIFSAPSVTPYWVAPYGTATKRFWVHAGLSAVYVDDGTTRTDITGTAPTGAVDDRWTGGVLNGVLFMNNGVDQPMYWGGDTALNLATLPGWDANWRAKSMGAFKYFLIAAGITKSGTSYPHLISWSSAADPGSVPASWDVADATVDTGDRDLSETPGIIIDQLGLGTLHIIYKEDSMYALEYIGGQEVFASRCFTKSYGMLARGCAVNTPKGHVVLANGDVVLHQGQGEPVSLLTSRLKKWLFQTQIDSTYYKRCFVTSNPTKSEVWICYPAYGQTSCTKALVWNWEDNTFGRRDLPNVTYAAPGLLDYSQGNKWSDYSGVTWADLVKAWNGNDYTPADPRLIMASTSPKLYLADSRATYDGTNVSAVLERTGMAFDDPYMVKTIRAVYPRIKATTGTVVYIQLGESMDAEVAPTWGEPFTYTVGSSLKADRFASGRFLALRIYSEGKQPWSIKSIDIDVVSRGAY